MDDNRFTQTYFGIEADDIYVNFGTFANWHKILAREYLSDGCSTVDFSEATLSTNKFIFPHHIKKTYYVEGTIEGQITFAASECTAYISKFRITLCKMNEDNDDSELASTNWVNADRNNDYKTLYWHSDYNYGDEIVYQFYIDVWQEKELTEYDRFYIKVEVDNSTCTDSACSCAVLMHTNDAEWEDLKVTIPFRL